MTDDFFQLLLIALALALYGTLVVMFARRRWIVIVAILPPIMVIAAALTS
jgi:hypothetical protein